MVRPLAILSVVLAFVPISWADGKTGEGAAQKQEILARKFPDFEQAQVRLTQRMEQSDKAAEREKAGVLRKALPAASKEGTDLKFQKLIQLLRTSHALDGSLNDLEEVLRQNKMVAADIAAILKLLLEDDRLAKLREDADWVAGGVRGLDRLVRGEEDH